MLLKGTIAAGSADSLDKTCLQTLDGDRPIFIKGEMHSGVILKQVLNKLDLSFLWLGNEEFREITISEKGEFLTIFRQNISQLVRGN